LPSVLQHVAVLETSGLVHSQKIGRTRTCKLDTKPLHAAESWISARRTAMERRLDRLGTYLADTKPQQPRRKRS
jgi:DNA-binding transcriptional ArsR family regulator